MTYEKVIKLARKYSEKYKLLPQERDLLLRIDNSDYHHMNADELQGDDAIFINSLQAKGMIKKMPANKFFPERYVVTTTGSYALGVFDYSDMYG